MKDGSTVPSYVVGIDLGDRSSRVCVLDAGTGETLEESRVRTTRLGLEQRFSGVERMRVALEVGAHSRWVSQCLAELGHEVIVANPRKVRLISQNRSKDDRVDARVLAQLARVDPQLLYPVRHRGEAAQTDLAVLRSRDVLVRCRTRLILHCRGAAKAAGHRLPSCSAHSFAGQVLPKLPSSLDLALGPVVEMIGELTRRIRRADRQIEQIARDRYPEVARMTRVRGVGTLTALAFVLTLEDPHRFRRSREVGPYLGLVPARAESGQSRPQLRITKQGDRFLRGLLVQCGHYILGPFGEDCNLRRHGEAIQQRGGQRAKKTAAVAVARKLAVLLHRLWIHEAPYEPFYRPRQPQLAA